MVLSIGMLAGCTDLMPSSTEPAPSGQEQTLKSVKVTKTGKQKMGEALMYAGEVKSSVRFDIVTKAGGDVAQVLKHRGDVVQEGEVLIRLHSTDLAFEQERAALAVSNAQEAIRKARERTRKEFDTQKQELNRSIQKLEQSAGELTKSYNKMKNDYDIGLATKTQVYQAELALKGARSELDELVQRRNTLAPADDQTAELETQLRTAQMSLQQIEQSIASLDVKAPVSGVLTELSLEQGMTISSGSKAGVIEKLDPIKVKAMLSEELTKFIAGKTELPYETAGSKQKLTGKVTFLSKVIDPETKAYELNLEAPNQDLALKPGMKVYIQLADEQEQMVLSVPTFSIVKEGDDAFVFVLQGDIAEKRKVVLGRTNEPYQEVLSGVKEGEEVVTSNPGQLKDKEQVHRAAVEEIK
jgi:HlyD family secretion protein